jgi:FADH2 O2-dependent halogenase
LLASLAETYGIEEFRWLASYGSWKSKFPFLRCGLKRGFSYFAHQPQRLLSDTQEHHDSLLVAASVSDELSDTHWVRSDVDHFLFALAQKHGVQTFECAKVVNLERTNFQWKLELDVSGQGTESQTNWVIDATGSSTFGRSFLNAGSRDHELHTQAKSIYGHFTNVGNVESTFDTQGSSAFDWTFCPDNAAQHHIVTDGWVWMLRFDNELTSVGLMTRDFKTPLKRQWDAVIANYPSVKQMMSMAMLVDSVSSETKPLDRLYSIDHQVARCNQSAYGDGWIALPSAFGFIDPLHSTGIGHNLTGVRRIATIFDKQSKANLVQALARYEEQLISEIDWIDTLVSLCYEGLPNSRLFMNLSSAYFVAILAQESSLTDKHVSDDFLSASNSDLRIPITAFRNKLSTLPQEVKLQQEEQIVNELKQTIQPWNRVNLLASNTRNRISHSAVPKWMH